MLNIHLHNLWRDLKSCHLKSCDQWRLLSLLVPLYFGIITLTYALPDTIVQDDARQHVVWLQQFFDPALFPDDAIADYFQSVAPPGYKFLYWSFAKLGVSALVLAKWIPIVLAIITTLYFYQFCLTLVPIPVFAWFSTLILNEMIWMKDDLCSATPRAFTFPIFAAFLYYLVRARSLMPVLMAIALQGLFFPQLVILQIATLTLRLLNWQHRKLQWSNRRSFKLWLLGMIVAAVTVIPFVLSLRDVGATFSAAQMQLMPEFSPQGRMKYYGVPFFSIGVSGLTELKIPWYPVIVLAGLLLPWLRRSPAIRAIQPEAKVLVQLLVAAVSLYILAAFLYPKLYFPNRYTYYVLRFVLAIAAGLVLYDWLIALSRQLKQVRTVLIEDGAAEPRHPQSKISLWKKITIAIATTLLFLSITLPFIPNLFLRFHIWYEAQHPALYQYLNQQPKDIRIASLSLVANNIPAFSQRSVWVSDEFALPFHQRYYSQLQERAIATLTLQYSADRAEIKQIIQANHITHLLLDNDSFTPTYLLNKNWLIHSSFQSAVEVAIAQLQRPEAPAITQYFATCTVVTEQNIRLLDTRCVVARE
jgi:hypothetical protein